MTTLTEKVEYVRARIGSKQRDHACHWPGCTQQVHPAQWGCRQHWFALPRPMRNKIWSTFKPGQEAAQTPSADYVIAAREVQDWIAQYLKLTVPR